MDEVEGMVSTIPSIMTEDSEKEMRALSAFRLVKEQVDAVKVAKAYGLKVNRSGMARCPFHNDHSPSMKVDRRFYCFGCGATGDSIDLAGRLLDLSPFDSMIRIANDFGIDIWKNKNLPLSGKKMIPIHPSNGKQKNEEDPRENRREWRDKATRILLWYRSQLKEWKILCAPTQEDEEWEPKFEESLALQDKVEYWLDILLFGEDVEKDALYKDLHEEVNRLEYRYKRKNS